MRHFMMFLPISLLVLPVAGLFGQQLENMKSSERDAREPVCEAIATSPERSLPFTRIETVRGTIVGIEKGLGRFTIVTPEERLIVIQVEMKSSVRLAGNEVEVWNLRPGDKVAVTYREEDGRNIARSVVIER